MESKLLKELKGERELNFKQRLDFVRFWANYVRTHPNSEWSRQQAVLLDGIGKNQPDREAYMKVLEFKQRRRSL